MKGPYWYLKKYFNDIYYEHVGIGTMKAKVNNQLVGWLVGFYGMPVV